MALPGRMALGGSTHSKVLSPSAGSMKHIHTKKTNPPITERDLSMKALLPGETTSIIIQKISSNCNPLRFMQTNSDELLHRCANFQELRIKRGRDKYTQAG
jgi:hypothetical protein